MGLFSIKYDVLQKVVLGIEFLERGQIQEWVEPVKIYID